MDWVDLRLWRGLWWQFSVWVCIELRHTNLKIRELEAANKGKDQLWTDWGRDRADWGWETKRTEGAEDFCEGGRQTVLETLHSKSQFILHITRFPYCRVPNSYTGIFYCPKATLECQCGENLPRTRLQSSRVTLITRLLCDRVLK